MKTPINSGHLYIISGPSGVGKGTIITELLRRRPLHLAVSATTRPIRSGETPGKSYYYMSDLEFDQHVQSGDFLEYCTVHTARYGTLRSEVLDYISQGQDVLIEIDVQGAKKIKDILPDAVTLFLLPPDMNELMIRLKGRMTESEDIISARIQVAKEELAQSSWYEYTVVNRDIHTAVEQLLNILSK